MGELLKLIQNLKKNFTTDLKKLITFIKDYNGDDWINCYKSEKNKFYCLFE